MKLIDFFTRYSKENTQAELIQRLRDQLRENLKQHPSDNKKTEKQEIATVERHKAKVTDKEADRLVAKAGNKARGTHAVSGKNESHTSLQAAKLSADKVQRYQLAAIARKINDGKEPVSHGTTANEVLRENSSVKEKAFEGTADGRILDQAKEEQELSQARQALKQNIFEAKTIDVESYIAKHEAVHNVEFSEIEKIIILQKLAEEAMLEDASQVTQQNIEYMQQLEEARQKLEEDENSLHRGLRRL